MPLLFGHVKVLFNGMQKVIVQCCAIEQTRAPYTLNILQVSIISVITSRSNRFMLSHYTVNGNKLLQTFQQKCNNS